MPMVGPAMVTELTSILAGSGFVGVDMPLLTNAVGNGVITSIVGTTFQTLETGTGPGPGLGNGVGILGIEGPTIGNAIFAQGASFGIIPNLDFKSLADGIGQSLASQLKVASLTSQSLNVHIGLGTITPGSIAVIGPKISKAVTDLGIASLFGGTDWPLVASAIGSGIELAFKTGTGQVTITGTAPAITAPVLPPGVPGTGILF